MDRLIAFGCSLTYGHGLPDCHLPPDGPGLHPTQMGWASIVARYMNRVCVNKSSPGSSNKRIWNEIVNFDYKENDIVFIQWSFVDRTAIIKKNETVDIGPWTNNYHEHNDSHDSLIMSKLFVSHSNMFLKSKNITVYNMVPENPELPILKLGGQTVDHIPVYIAKLKDKYPLALDNRHPGIDCQLAVSKQILDYLKIHNDITHTKPMGLFGQAKRQTMLMKRKING